MRRKSDDKRVLRSGNGRKSSSKRRVRRNNNRQNTHPLKSRVQNNRRTTKKKRKASGTILLFMIVALVAFVIGAGIGVSLSLDDGSDDGPHFENVTKEMTSNLNDTEQVYFEKDVDDVDFNENGTSQFDFQYEYTYEDN